MSRPRRSSPSLAWPRFAALALIGVAAAGCSNSARFDTPYPTAQVQQQRQFESTGSISRTPPRSRVYSQPLPSPARPATVSTYGGYSNGASGLGAYRPNGEVTGSIVPPAPAPNGYWTWDGGQPVTVGYGESAEMIARKYGVPESALLQTNGITNPSQIQAGQRLVIPRYVAASAQPVPAPVQPAPVYGGNVHVAAPGESLIGIARRYHLSLTGLARFNNIDPYTKLNVGDRINIPPGRQAAAQSAQATTPAQRPSVSPPRIAQAHSTPVEKVASVPPQTARMATPEPSSTAAASHAEAQPEANAGVPSFRWPVHGRVITAFGARPNGVQNDGINLAVPEGTPVKAADDGVVAYAGNELKGYGNLVLIRHANGYVSAYANASDLTVKRGDTIKRGQVIAHAGQTGNVTSPQLHFEIRKGSTPVDPTKYLSGA
ncbi:MAG TPA: peptidoglycan DD-metalloendopeptidase family protein [Pseudolabrys sp.]|nr:peptidoglycan DD-metalloendopeptidase family protein [Pseudolabrys sp.]